MESIPPTCCLLTPAPALKFIQSTKYNGYPTRYVPLAFVIPMLHEGNCHVDYFY